MTTDSRSGNLCKPDNPMNRRHPYESSLRRSEAGQGRNMSCPVNAERTVSNPRRQEPVRNRSSELCDWPLLEVPSLSSRRPLRGCHFRSRLDGAQGRHRPPGYAPRPDRLSTGNRRVKRDVDNAPFRLVPVRGAVAGVPGRWRDAGGHGIDCHAHLGTGARRSFRSVCLERDTWIAQGARGTGGGRAEAPSRDAAVHHGDAGNGPHRVSHGVSQESRQ